MPAALSRTSFALLLLCCWWTFFAFGTAWPLLPQWTVHDAGLDRSWVGVALTGVAVGGIVGRIPAGIVLKHGNAWAVIAAAATLSGLSNLMLPLSESPVWLVGWRFLSGCGSGACFTAIMTCLVHGTDPARLGSRLSYLSIPLYLGEAFGAPWCDFLLEHTSYAMAWVSVGTSALLAVPSALLGLRLAGRARTGARVERTPITAGELVRTVLHPLALLPAAALFLIMAGWAAFQAFGPLLAPTVGIEHSGRLFLVFAIVVLIVRLAGARAFDRLSMAWLVLAGGLTNVAAQLALFTWTGAATLFVAVALMGLTQALVYTNLLNAAVTGIPPAETASVTSTYSLAFDLSIGLNASILGIALAQFGYGGMFLSAGVVGMAGIALAGWFFLDRHQALSVARAA